MKTFYTLITTLIICAFFSISANAQPTLKTWTNATNNDNWHDPDNWSPNGVPAQTGLGTDDVLIPANSIVNILAGAPSAVSNNLTVEEGAVVTKFNNLAFSTFNGNFAPGSELNLLNGSIQGIQELIINGEFNCIGPLPKTVVGTINVTGTMQIQSPSDPLIIGGDLRIFPSGILTVEEGTINTLNFGKLINEGTLQKTAGTGIFNMGCIFENNGGSIDLISGSMEFTNTTTFTNGAYNVNESGFLKTSANNTIFINGTLTGQLDGPFIIDSNSFRLSDGVDTVLNFSGPAGLVWQGGALSSQDVFGNTLVNLGLITVTSLGNSQTQLGAGVILRNEGELFFEETATNFAINQSSILDNTALGEITIADDVSIFVFTGSTFTNTGLVQKVAGMGSASINTLDNDGNLNCESGTLIISQNLTTGISGSYGGSGNLQFPTGFVLEGQLSPGSSPGTLTIIGNLTTTAAATYDIEIDGLIASTEYDRLNITNNAILEGTINIALGFEPEVNDEFVIVTANAITQCNLPAQVISNFNGNDYTFNVICNPNNVTLQLIEISLGIDENTLIDANVYPNPTSGNFKIDFSKMQSEVSVSILNILGQVITNERFVNTNTVDLTIDGSPGMYFINVSSSDGNQNTFKIIKK